MICQNIVHYETQFNRIFSVNHVFKHIIIFFYQKELENLYFLKPKRTKPRTSH